MTKHINIDEVYPRWNKVKQTKLGYVLQRQEAIDQLYDLMLEIIGEDEEIPVENRMSDPLQVREFNQLIKIVKGKNATRQEQRQKLTDLFKGDKK